MSYLNNVSHTQDIEAEVTIELDLLDLVYKHVESVDDLKEVLGSVSDHISKGYQEQLHATGYRNTDNDLIDLICSAENDEVLDVLHTILSSHPRALHQFMTCKHKEVKLAMIESSQSILVDLEASI
nr:hypothetical protein [Moritella viscosa]SHO18162.1 Ureidoglycolate lyase [Moritella viscosa]